MYIDLQSYIKVTDWPNWHFITQKNVQLNIIGKNHLNNPPLSPKLAKKSKMAAIKLEYIYISACQREITDCDMSNIDVHRFSWMGMM